MPLGGKLVPCLGFICDCWGLAGICLCCCCCKGCGGGCCCCGGGFWDGIRPWLLILSSSSFFRTPACIFLLISFLFRISSLSRFCSSIFKRYCRVSSSSSGSYDTKYKSTTSQAVSFSVRKTKALRHCSTFKPNQLA